MLNFIARKDIGVYKTIYEEDVSNFIQVCSSDIFKTENKFELITDKNEIRKILDEKYSSKSRTEEYTSGLPSATVISSGLYPLNLNQYDRNNSVNLLKWFNDKSKEEYDVQQEENKKSLENGTFIHKVLELAVTDKTRIFTRKNKLKDYVHEALESSDIKREIKDIESKREYLSVMSSEVLKQFFEFELQRIDCIFSEIFIKLPKIQGAIDLVFIRDGILHIGDYKSSKKSKSRNQLIDAGYLRQLWVYSEMLLEAGIISKKMYNELEFSLFFFNWNSYKSKVENFTKDEVGDSKLVCEYLLSWYWDMKNGI